MIPDAHVGPIGVVIVPLVFDVHALVGDQICGSDVPIATGGNNPRRLKRIERNLKCHSKKYLKDVALKTSKLRCINKLYYFQIEVI